jgi:hypothetical protein
MRIVGGNAMLGAVAVFKLTARVRPPKPGRLADREQNAMRCTANIKIINSLV